MEINTRAKQHVPDHAQRVHKEEIAAEQRAAPK
jgi:hypothetical protein